MSRWMVNVRGQSFSAGGMDELKQLAKKGEIGGGDIVQPPGASEWLYAVEIPELKVALRPDELDGMDLADGSVGLSPMVKGAMASVMVLASLGMSAYAVQLRNSIPTEQLQIHDESGERGVSYKEVFITAKDASLKAEANPNSADVQPLKKDARAELLGKRGGWYKLRFEGKEGYAPVDAVLPGYYMADEKTKQDYDPLYNPDKYVTVGNASWTMTAEKAKKGISDMAASLQNDSKFPMTDIRVVATLKDSAGNVIKEKEMPVEGVLGANRSDMIGTLNPAKGDDITPPRIMFTSEFEKIVLEDPKAADRWIDVVEVDVGKLEALEAGVIIAEVRAIPPEG